MTYWLTESSLVPLIIGTFIVIALLGLAISFRDRIMFYLALLVAVLTAGTTVTEMLIVTDREAVTEVIQILAQAVEKNDVAEVLAHVSGKQGDAQDRIRKEMPNYHFTSCRIVGINGFSSVDNGGAKTAEIDFVVFAFGSSRQNEGHVHRRIILKFEQEPNGLWKLLDYEHSEPRGGMHL